MKYKNILLVVLLFTLFFSQQVQEARTISFEENSSLINSAQPNTSRLFPFVYVYVYQLTPGSGQIVPSNQKCSWPNHFGIYGCGDDWPVSGVGTEGYLIVNVEQDYLRDVIATEMNLAQIPPELEALKAQAIASRSVASWKSDNGPWDNGFGEPYGNRPIINNSITYQVFIPGAHISSIYKSDIDTAVNQTNNQFLQYIIGDNHVIDASFSADMLGAITSSGDISAPYLTGIQDPISTGCVLDLGNAQYGMSQRGAIRWAKGNTCPDGTGSSWPIKWNHQQILVHYYTGVDIIDDTNGNPVAPYNRWNLLNFNNNQPITMVSGQTYNNISIHLQNTSTSDWASNEIMLGYRWSETESWTDAGTLPEIIVKGDDTAVDISILAPPTGGTHILHLDVRHANNSNSWFSNSNWPDAEISIVVDGPTATSTLTPTSIPAEGDWILLGTWSDVGCNSEYSFPAVTAKQFKIKMTQGGGWDNRISFYGEGSSGAAWLANGSWQEVNNQTYDLYVGQERETNVFDPAIVSQQRFRVGCNDGETMNVEVYYRITYGPTPTLASYPTTTLTLAPTPIGPTPDYDCYCAIDFLANQIVIPIPCWDIFFSSNNFKLAAPINLLQSTQQAILDVELFHRVEDEILSQTPQGEEYIDLYYEHSPQIIQILMDNSTLKDEAIDVLQMWEPNLQALVDGQGDTVTITNAQVQAVQDFLNHLSAQASPALQQVIADEQLQQPLEQFVNVSMDVALEYVEDGVSETATPSPTPTATFTVTPTATFTPTITATPSATSTPTSFIFADDFESGNLNAWSVKVTGGGDLSVSSNSGLQGAYGLQALINDTASIYVTDYSPINDTQYHARFLLDPNSISIPNNNSFAIFTGSGGNGITFRLMLYNESNVYKLQMWVMNDNEVWVASNKVVIADEPQAIELEFKSSSAAGANNGYTKLWINNTLVDTFSNLDNDTRFLGQVSLGAVQSLDAGTSGTIYFDHFISNRTNYIGP